MDADDIKMLQSALEIITGESISPNGNFGHYTDKVLKICQEKIGLNPNGIVDQLSWEKIISNFLAILC
jgi:hypothetical protein